jgi:hypothetical protein
MNKELYEHMREQKRLEPIQWEAKATPWSRSDTYILAICIVTVGYVLIRLAW